MKTISMKKKLSLLAISLSAFAFLNCAQIEETATATIAAPSALTYANSTLVLAQNTAIGTVTPTVTGTVTSCSAAPTLPTGLSLSGTSCALSGTPTATQTQTTYTVTASNATGSTSATLKIAVVDYTATIVGTPTHSVGKSVFQIKLTNSAGTGQAGLNPTVIPTMDMGTMVHTTPVDTVADNGGGNYTVTTYYIMASMGGTWYIKTYNTAGTTEIATPLTVTVGGMGTARVSLSEATDQYSQMGTATNRPYFIFVDSISGSAGNHTVNVYAATRKTLMSHPSLVTGLTLTPFTGADWNTTTLAVTMSTDGGTTFPYTLTNNGTGHFSVAGVTGLTAGSKSLTFRLVVNGTTKMSGANTYGTLTAMVP